MNKRILTVLYVLLMLVTGGIVYHDYVTVGVWNRGFLVLLLVLTVIYVILLLSKPKKKNGYFDDDEVA